MTNFQPQYDIAIRGAGPVGLTLARLLVKRGMPAQRIALLDARPLAQALADPRSLALSYGSSEILRQLGAWPIAANRIEQIHISRRGHFGRTLIDHTDYALPALGYVTRYGILLAALARACDDAGIVTMRPTKVVAEHSDQQAAWLDLADSDAISAKILVQAEGGVFADQTAKAQRRDYAQTAIVARVAVSAPQPHRAYERFTDQGPLALLPQIEGEDAAAQSSDVFADSAVNATTTTTDARPVRNANAHFDYALVWCMRPATTEVLMQQNDADFLAALAQAFGSRLGKFLRVSERRPFALGLNADAAVTGRVVAIGNAAQTLHPVAGQGLNLGLRDAVVLANLLARETTPLALQQFLKERRSDRRLTIGLTDTMARVFATSRGGAISQSLLGLSLGLIDGFAPARRLLAEQMMYGWRS